MVERTGETQSSERLLTVSTFDDLIEMTQACKESIEKKMKIKAKQQKPLDPQEEHGRVLDEYEEILVHILGEVGQAKFLEVIFGRDSV